MSDQSPPVPRGGIRLFDRADFTTPVTFDVPEIHLELLNGANKMLRVIGGPITFDAPDPDGFVSGGEQWYPEVVIL